MKILNAEYITSATKSDELPAMKYPEIAFSGRSNVGKSSLLNSIVMRKNLARTSSNPGKTRQINFYLVDNKILLADLPGFGYAAVSKSQREDWVKLNMNYFEKRENLKLVCVLVDSRHEPMEKDLGLIELLEMYNKNYIIIMTKCDKIAETQIQQRKEQFEHVVKNCKYCLEALPYSVINGRGRKELMAIIDRLTKKIKN
jgi:GTP-binding protein